MLLSIVMSLLTLIVVIVLLGWLTSRMLLAGEDLSQFDQPEPETVNAGQAVSEGQALVESAITDMGARVQSTDVKNRLKRVRELMDEGLVSVNLDGFQIEPVDAGGVPAEWIRLPHSPAQKRLLYIHGGAFMAGSPRSHRAITTALCRELDVSVLSIDYRLLPEHNRHACIEDCQRAYDWILANGPEGPCAAQELLMAGDSAGGNLALVITNWVKESGRRQADAVIALSPATDATFASPTLRALASRDVMLGRQFGAMMKFPRWLLLWGSWMNLKIAPADPLLSPLRADLSDLPPILVQASTEEMLLGDGVRYVNKARASGSPAQLQLWHGMVHVWQVFAPVLPEATAAIGEMGRFVRETRSARADQADQAAA